ncbi:pantoate--beta-alanine ligase [Paenibacillus shirakamiensis]|uniref:Pantothenate synthetase n=1 Tax=Paenibacillus shirakamiensis TaxID=1265935 RepID=A0ABS4JEM0_9BACL|nr:pantoate--beta-alanine ligase [Paenibacillus shirakamiensis]MBP1999576.1 pantoate--beta-alanine ligase [Paenibacillus shirakamiensis]
MKVIGEVQVLRESVRQERNAAMRQGREISVGLVPTMGFLHEGHASLLREARAKNDLVVLSIFVNPIQFGPNEDFERYPRNEQSDLALAEREGVDIVFIPSVVEMYPKPAKTRIVVSELTSSLCGASRPGHFDGVTTVVSKLFHLVAPDYAYFGMKDAQQIAVIQQMVEDLNFDVTIEACPIVREEDGLALSSRNVYLSSEDRKQALILSDSLQQVQHDLQGDQKVTATELVERVTGLIRSKPLANIDYVQVLEFPTLNEIGRDVDLRHVEHDVIVAVAVKFGTTRLIDNVVISSKGVPVHV